jgi:hypothetical protein
VTEQQQTSDPIAAALAIIEALERRQTTHTERLEANRKIRGQLAYAAHTGDDKAKRQLADLGAEHRRLEDEADELEAALAQARANHVRACRDAELEESREQGREVERVFGELAGVVRLMDQAREAFEKAAGAYAEIAEAINAEGCPFPSGAQVRLCFQRYLQSLIVGCPWSNTFEARYPAPNERVPSMQAIVASWRAGPAERWLADKLRGSPQQAAE